MLGQFDDVFHLGSDKDANATDLVRERRRPGSSGLSRKIRDVAGSDSALRVAYFCGAQTNRTSRVPSLLNRLQWSDCAES